MREFVQEKYGQGGRPSIDPVVFFKLQLVMFFEGIRSERLLMRHAVDRLSVRWYLGYDLNEPLPDHSSLTRIRTRYGVEIFTRFFESIVQQCQQARLVGGREVFADATKAEANAALDSLTPRFAVEEHLKTLFSGEPGEPLTPHTAPAAGEVAAPPLLHPDLPAPLTEQLSQQNSQRHDWFEHDGAPDRETMRGNYQRQADFQVSATDPDATMMPMKNGAHLGYQTHYLVDGGKSRIILACLVTPSEVMENQPALDLLWRACFRWKIRPRQFTGDTTYGSAENIMALEQQGIRAYVPLPDFDQRTGFFGQRAFRYDAERDVYLCPAEKELQVLPSGCTDQFIQYRGKPSVCNSCPLKAQCTTSMTGRRLSRQVAEEHLERVRAYHATEPYKKAMRKRSVWVEPLFAEGKQWHGMRRFRLRRLWRVNSEALIRAAGQNLKRLLTQRGWGRRPGPTGEALALFFFFLLFSSERAGRKDMSARLSVILFLICLLVKVQGIFQQAA
ncbi:MAG TPA: IS1182 family transposase [Ktedonobacteraceae bacterium]|nr:IS1182 family transposase [Ktedonobacteraceae bacterium]